MKKILLIILIILPINIFAYETKYEKFSTHPPLETRFVDGEELYFKVGDDKIPYTGNYELSEIRHKFDKKNDFYEKTIYLNGVRLKLGSERKYYYSDGKKVMISTLLQENKFGESILFIKNFYINGKTAKLLALPRDEVVEFDGFLYDYSGKLLDYISVPARDYDLINIRFGTSGEFCYDFYSKNGVDLVKTKIFYENGILKEELDYKSNKIVAFEKYDKTGKLLENKGTLTPYSVPRKKHEEQIIIDEKKLKEFDLDETPVQSWKGLLFETGKIVDGKIVERIAVD